MIYSNVRDVILNKTYKNDSNYFTHSVFGFIRE